MKRIAYIVIALLIAALLFVLLTKFVFPQSSQDSIRPIIKRNKQFPVLNQKAGLSKWGFEIIENRLVAAPEFSISDISGNEVSLGDFRGKMLILNFWATWCPPCREEIPSLQALAKELGLHDIEVFTISSGEAFSTVKTFADQIQMSLPVAVDEPGRISLSYNVASYPTTFIINEQGNFIARKVGGMDWADIELWDTLVQLKQR